MREIGSEFWEIEVGINDNKLFPNDTKWFISGRSALNYILENLLHKKQIQSAWLPSWCCESMIIPFINHGIEVDFYPVYFEQGKLVFDIPNDGELILVMDYFGFSCPIELCGFPGIVIRDLTHSVHSRKYGDSDFSFGSLRKWTGISTGGFAISRKPWELDIHVMPVNRTYTELKESAMQDKANYIKGITDDKSYLETYAKAEDILEKSGIVLACEEDVRNAHYFDIEYISGRRKRNAEYLMNELNEFLVFDRLSDTDCPLFIPVLINNRDKIRQFLIENRVYCPVHWPISKYHKLDCRTEKIYKKELSIICDQRYELKHMEHMVKLIKKGMELC